MTEAAGFWHAVSRRLEADTGLHFATSQWPDMRRGLALAASRLGLADDAACAAQLLAHALDAGQREVLAQCLTIGETYFFRDPDLFDAIGREVLLPLIDTRRAGTRHLRLWSAGCASGEEAYSLAMLLATLLPDWREWNITLLATDLNAAALAKAKAGIYGRWSLRGGIPAAARAFLRPLAGGRHEVDAGLRRMVRFEPLNLVRDLYPSTGTGTAAMDLVICRNVLIYFEAARAQEVLRRLGTCLAGGGWLVTGSVELPARGVAGLQRHRLGELTALRSAVPVSPPVRARAPSAVKTAVPAQATRPASTTPPPVAPPPVPANVPTPQSVQRLADAGELPAAEAQCRQAMGNDKLDAQWPWLLASILAEQGREPEAIRALQRTLYLDPGHVLARFTLGSLQLRVGTRSARKHLSVVLAQLQARAPEEVIQGSGGLSARELQSLIHRMTAST